MILIIVQWLYSILFFLHNSIFIKIFDIIVSFSVPAFVLYFYDFQKQLLFYIHFLYLCCILYAWKVL